MEKMIIYVIVCIVIVLLLRRGWRFFTDVPRDCSGCSKSGCSHKDSASKKK